ncbi:Hpt domain-containing protein [Anaerocolumna sp. MB42-C2]|uniref:Hpt domain-containing protein n=1 Tax=Anaerocolumna sp. MB42-C2 TaxID=3070997 RepID=UPI0027DF3A66|nr:Hpt domain-containing protein [Anaerocolumna sp. MB42-C2]WMJ85316.1 Hpt domain-containing protein [Anaerocolumna sp. MB42-C2]
MDEIIVDIYSFRKDAGLDYDTLKELYFIFAEEIIQEKNEINTYLEQNKAEELLPVVHKMKGIASSYRTPVILEIAVGLESKLKNKDFDTLEPVINQLNKAIAQVADAIALYFQN